MSRIVLILSIVIAISGALLNLVMGSANLRGMPAFSVKALMVLSGIGILTSVLGRRIFGIRETDRFFVNMTILSLTLAFLLVLSEFATRLALYDITTTSDNVSYFSSRWKEKEVRSNRWGFRERDFSAVKPPEVYRIAVIGDSFAYGQGIAEKDRFSNLLEKQLDAAGGKFEVLNFGRAGTETLDHVRLLSDVVVGLRPNYVLLQWFTNDVEGVDKHDRPQPMKLLPSSVLHSVLSRSSALYYLLHQQWINLQYQFGLVDTYEYYMMGRFADPNSNPSQAANEALERFIGVCRTHGIPVGIILFSSRSSSLDFITERVLDVCARHRISCVDIRDVLTLYSRGDPKLWANRLDPHPGPLENRLAADRIFEVLGKSWLDGQGRL